MLYEPQEGSGREIKHPELIPSKAVREYMEQAECKRSGVEEGNSI